MDQREGVARIIATPTLVIAGTHDAVHDRPPTARSSRSAIPGARYVELDAAHICPTSRRPAAFNAALTLLPAGRIQP